MAKERLRNTHKRSLTSISTKSWARRGGTKRTGRACGPRAALHQWSAINDVQCIKHTEMRAYPTGCRRASHPPALWLTKAPASGP